MNIPNLITTVRILLIPLLVIFLLEHKTDLALLVFVIAGVSDALDGFLARILHQKTLFGAYIDPIADKLLLSTSFVTLAILQFLPSWLAVVVISRDVIILGGFVILLFNNRDLDIKPTIISKVTTFVQLVTVCFILAHGYVKPFWFIANSLYQLTALFTMVSGFHYIVIGFRILGNNGRSTHQNSVDNSDAG